VLLWTAATMAIGFALLSISIPLLVVIRRASRWPEIAAMVALVLMWTAFGLLASITFVSRRLNYGLRWYIVTDRSLRIRSGIFQVNELTMTYSNIQEIRVASGPLQNLLGIADVEVQAAGGGGGDRHGGGHIGRFNGVSNANEIRDLIVNRLRQYRDSGLGEAHPSPSASGDEMAAARAMLDAVRELRAALSDAQH
jgi:membrane protein YdbS with pleckstrin-like domain